MREARKNIITAIAVIITSIVVFILFNNLIINLIRTKMWFSFDWLSQPSGFAISESVLQFEATDSYAFALLNGWLNSMKVIIFGLLLSTILGFGIGIARISENSLLRRVSSIYIIIIRQIPLLIQLLFWYFVGFLSLQNTDSETLNPLFKLSNQGVSLLGLSLTAEFTALLLGLSVFTSASIAEIVRGAINSISQGQWEAFKSLGISESLGIRKIIIPQSLPAIIPGLTSQYLNLAKNSTLAIAVGYADLYAISDTSITQTGRSIEGFLLLLLSFLTLNLIITNTMEILNKLSLRR